MQNAFEIVVAPAHPAFAGHFPGDPIVPGVLLLDWVLGGIEAREPCLFKRGALLPGELSVVKFLLPVRPGDVLLANYACGATKITCRIECRGQLVATAAFALHTAASAAP